MEFGHIFLFDQFVSLHVTKSWIFLLLLVKGLLFITLRLETVTWLYSGCSYAFINLNN